MPPIDHVHDEDGFARALDRAERQARELRAREEAAELEAARRLLPPSDSREHCYGDDSGRWHKPGWRFWFLFDAIFFGGLLLGLVGVLVLARHLK